MPTKVSTWKEFAKVTIETNDLDPTYVFLYNAKQDKGEDWATKFALHYLCFYDLGGAAKAAQYCSQENFWEHVLEHFDKFKRGTERRHSRGDVGKTYVRNLAALGTPQALWDEMYATTYSGMVIKFKQRFPNCGFGPYFLWKVLDFQERIWSRPITLTLEEAVCYCPDDPRKCATILWPDKHFHEVLNLVTDYISQFMAPPTYDRRCSFQEAETVLCMLKGYFITRTHTIGDDIDSKYEQLSDMRHLLKYLPPRQDWTQYERGFVAP